MPADYEDAVIKAARMRLQSLLPGASTDFARELLTRLAKARADLADANTSRDDTLRRLGEKTKTLNAAKVQRAFDDGAAIRAGERERCARWLDNHADAVTAGGLPVSASHSRNAAIALRKLPDTDEEKSDG
jgi:hypothetical protein